MSDKPNSVKPTGMILIATGLILLFAQITGFDALSGHAFWQLFIIIPGVVLLALASFEKTSGAALAQFGMMVTLTGCVLAYQDWADHYQSWAYAWIIVGPFALGAGLALYGRMHGDEKAAHNGKKMATNSAFVLLGAAAVFELVFNISGFGLLADLLWGILLPVALIVVGGAFFLRRSKRN